MDTQGKRTLLATVLCLAILFGWMKFFGPALPQPTTAPATSQTTSDRADLFQQAATTQPTSASCMQPTSASSTQPAAELRSSDLYYAVNAESEQTVSLGNDRQNDAKANFINPYEMGVVITPRGAAVTSINLSRHRAAPPKDPKNPEFNPYILLKPVKDNNNKKVFHSFTTQAIRLPDELQTVQLDNAIWSLQKESTSSGEKAVLQTRVKTGKTPETDVFEITKTYTLDRGSPCLRVGLDIRNLSGTKRNILLTEEGPAGIHEDDSRNDSRRVVTAAIETDSGKIVNGASPETRPSVIKAEEGKKEMLPGEGRQRLWAASGNKYFACIVDPLPISKSEKFPNYVGQVFARAFLEKESIGDDLSFEWLLKPKQALEPEGQPNDRISLEFSVYCGPKSKRVFENLPTQVRDHHYEIVSYPDVPSCTFSSLTSLMEWLLTRSNDLVHNYGIAIFILVIAVRVVLHPISKRSQMNMMKMQKGMGKLKPKIEAIQEQYKNDKARLQEETMKIYKEEGINPASQFFGCLPMFLQMPILVALYTALNYDVDLRHQPFCLWIRDLAAPDALIPFSSSFDIPLIGSMVGTIHALNILPLIMAVSMYAQQKFMQKLTAASTPPQPVKTDKHGNPIPDQMAQQQKMMNFMMIFFGLMFYNLPSGLNLYFLTSNLLGMLEQYIIKREIRQRDARGEFDVKKTPEKALGKPSLFTRYINMMQKKAEDVRLSQSDRPQRSTKNKRDR